MFTFTLLLGMGLLALAEVATAPDATDAPAAPPTTPTPDADAAATGTGKPGAEQAAAGEPAESPEVPQIRSRARERIQGLIRENKAKDTELRELRGKAGKTTDQGDDTARARDRQGRFTPEETDEEGPYIKIDGEDIPRGFATRHLALEDRVERMEQRDREAEEAEYQQQQGERWGRVYAEGERALTEEITAVYGPRYDFNPAERADVEAAAIGAAAQLLLEQTGGDPERLTEDILVNSIAAGMARLKRLAIVFSRPQKAANAEAAAGVPVPGEGMAATPGAKTAEQMSAAERRQTDDSLFQRVRSRLSGGRRT